MSASTPSDLLSGHRLLLTGVVTRDSIAWHVAERAQAAGAEIVLTGFGRARRLTERAAKQLSTPAEVIELDVNAPEDLEALGGEIDRRFDGRLDGVLHAIAFAPGDALGGAFLDTPAASAEQAFTTSAFSLKSLTTAVLPHLERSGRGSVVGLDFDASVAWPIYDWMGVAKAALESTSRYLARYVGPRGVRVNLVSAGPLGTMAARGIPGFSQLADGWNTAAPLRWDVEDPTPTADAILFLLSPLARAITGEILHVDGGVHSSAPVGAGPSSDAAGGASA